jgi:hypothetical protein
VRGKGVLVVGRSSVRSRLEPELVQLGLDHEWVTSAAAATQAGYRRHFEVALVDVGMRSPEAVFRGPRIARTVVLFSIGGEGADIRTDAEVVPVEQAAATAREILAGGPGPAIPDAGGR